MKIETPRIKLSDNLKLMFTKVERYIDKLSGSILQQKTYQQNEMEKQGLNINEINLKLKELEKNLIKENNLKIEKIQKKLAQTLFIQKNNKPDLDGYKPSKFSSVDEQQWFEKKLTNEEKNLDLMARFKIYKVNEKSASPSLDDRIMYETAVNCREVIFGNIVDKKRGLFKAEMEYLNKQFERSPYYKEWWENSNESKKLSQKIGKAVSQINRNELILTYTLPIVSSVIKKNIEEYNSTITKLYKSDPKKSQEKIKETTTYWQSVEIGLSKLLPKLISLTEKQEKLSKTILNQTISLHSEKLEKEIESLEFNINLIANTLTPTALNKVKELHHLVVRISEGQNNLNQKEPENYRNISIEIKNTKGKSIKKSQTVAPLASEKQKRRFKKEVKNIQNERG